MEKWDIRDHEGNITGKTAIRGAFLEKGEFHLVVFVIVEHRDGQYLISKRMVNRPGAGLWEFVGGSVVAGEDSLTGAKRELHEEVGILAAHDDLKLLERRFFNESHPFILDVYHYVGDFNVEQLSLQQEEVESVKLVNKEEVLALIANKTFFNYMLYKKDYFK